MSDYISRQALCEYALNQKDKSVTPNDIMRFPSAQPEPCEDSVSRKAAIDVCDKAIDLWQGQLGEGIVIAVRKKIEELPSAQPEVIRCKDCKWKQGSECVRFADVRPFPDDYCSRAERKEA